MSVGTLAVTGANGFVGRHVVRQAAESGMDVWAVGRENGPSTEVATYSSRYFSADLTVQWPVPEGADAVIHLAGLAAVGPSFSDPQRYIAVNSAIVTNMCEAFLRRAEKPTLVLVSSGAVYASPVGDEALDEDARVAPTSPYTVAKLLVETQGAYYSNRGLNVVIARPFNHIGPGQTPGFLIPDLTRSLLSQDGDPVEVGNLDAARDFTDVRDVARAYLDLARTDDHRHMVYNVASGRSVTGRTILKLIASALGRSVPETRVDPSRLRPNDPARITGRATRMAGEFGWTPTVPIEQSVADYVQSVVGTSGHGAPRTLAP